MLNALEMFFHVKNKHTNPILYTNMPEECSSEFICTACYFISVIPQHEFRFPKNQKSSQDWPFLHLLKSGKKFSPYLDIQIATIWGWISFTLDDNTRILKLVVSVIRAQLTTHIQQRKIQPILCQLVSFCLIKQKALFVLLKPQRD